MCSLTNSVQHSVTPKQIPTDDILSSGQRKRVQHFSGKDSLTRFDYQYLHTASVTFVDFDELDPVKS